MVALLTVFFQYTRFGLAFRAVAEDQLAALAVGLRLPRIWASVWTTAGVIALVAGLLWGARLGRAVLPVADRAQGAAGPRARRVRLDRRCHRRRPDHRRHGEAGRGLYRRILSAAASKAGSPTPWRSWSCWSIRPACSAGGRSRGSEPWRAVASLSPRRRPRTASRTSRLGASGAWLAAAALLLAVAFVVAAADRRRLSVRGES